MRKNTMDFAAGHQPPPIRRRLLLVVFASVVPAALLVAALLVIEYFQERAHVESSTRATARALATAVDQRLGTTKAALQVLATSRLIGTQPEEFHNQANEVRRQQGLDVIGLLDTRLQPVMNTLRPPGTSLPPAGSAEEVRSVFQQGGPVATNVFRPFTGNGPAVAVGVPVARDGQIAYALVGGIPTESIRDLLLRQSLPEGWVATVVDRAGVVVARTHEHERFAGSKVREAFLQKIDTATEGSMDGVSLAGVPVLTSFSTAPVSGWRVSILVPREQLTAELEESLAVLVAATVATFAVSLGLALLLGQRLSASVLGLQEQARRLGRGEPVEPVAASFAEAAALGATLQRASVELRQAGDALASRESELEQSNDRLAGLVDSAMDGIVSIDEGQHVVLFNRAAEAIFGRPREQVLGLPLDQLIPAAARGGHARHVRDFGEAGVTTRRMGALGVVRGVRADGTEFPLEASISKVTTRDGLLFTAVVRDVSERVRAAEELAAVSLAASTLREQEKKRMARELHDDIAQTLAALKIDTSWLQGQAGLDADARCKLSRMNAMLGDGIVAIRRIAADMRPLVLDELGLPAALESLAEAFTDRTGVACALEVDPGLALDDPFATEVYRLVQEGLANVAKHARAEQVRLSVKRDGEQLRLRVQDDGCGFDPAQPRRQSSLGLVGLRERVELLRGTMAVRSAPGQGTSVEIAFPLPAQASS